MSEFSYRLMLSGKDICPSRLVTRGRKGRKEISHWDVGAIDRHGRVAKLGHILLQGETLEVLFLAVEEVSALTPSVLEADFEIVRHCDSQCNVELTAVEVAQIAAVDGTISFSCY
ncbi:MAG: hypothetical protein ACU0BK_09890 [Shimia sp.]|uniref:hypothetical protein n=1 Tax=Shimia sp. TaxID=1954381 RepID=UPI004058FB30